MAVDAMKFPHLAGMESVQASSQIVGEFLDWLQEEGLAICKPEGSGRYFPVMETTEQLLARHFGVDLMGVERERRLLLAEVQGQGK